MTKEIKETLAELGFNENDIKTYLALTQLGEAKASLVSKKTGLPRTTVISILEKLKKDGYITTHQYRGVTYFWIESPRVIVDIFENRLKMAAGLQETLIDFYRSDAHFPYVNVYDTKSNIKKNIEKIILSLSKKSVIYTIDTPGEGNYSKIYSDDFNKLLLGLKKKRQILTHTLIPYGTKKNVDDYKIKNQDIIIRELPQAIDFKSSLWLIKDKVFHFSGNQPLLVVIRHDKIFCSFQSLFDFLWNISKA
ncbi:MAG: helix-turn-helix domain-containing protein [Patescibacteria group bacterium]|nr:helix-turn-helix domain-containing protein [Patescibacteria group bacterium]